MALPASSSPPARYTTSSAADIYDGDGGGVTAARKPSIDFVAYFFFSLSLFSSFPVAQCVRGCVFFPFFSVIVWTPSWWMCAARRRSQIRVAPRDAATDVPVAQTRTATPGIF